MNISNNDIEKYIKFKLGTDPKWVIKALLYIHSQQTTMEQTTQQSVVLNQIGFDKYDAQFLSSLVDHYVVHKTFSKTIFKHLYKKIPKYWKQIYDISNMDKIKELMLKEKFAIQTNLFE